MNPELTTCNTCGGLYFSKGSGMFAGTPCQCIRSSEAPTVKEEKVLLKEIASSPDCASSVIKSCPFCASTNLSIDKTDCYEVLFVKCLDCGSEGGGGHTVKKAIDLWSRRYLIALANKTLERVRDGFANREEVVNTLSHTLEGKDNSQSYPKSVSACSSEATKGEETILELSHTACLQKIEELEEIKSYLSGVCEGQAQRITEDRKALYVAIEALERIDSGECQCSKHFDFCRCSNEIASECLQSIKEGNKE